MLFEAVGDGGVRKIIRKEVRLDSESHAAAENRRILGAGYDEAVRETMMKYPGSYYVSKH